MPRCRRSRALPAGPALVVAAALAATVPATARATTPVPVQAPTGATISGTLREQTAQRLPGMRIDAEPAGVTTCTAASGCSSTYSGPHGGYSLSGLSAGRYDIDVLDGAAITIVAHVTIPSATATLTRALTLGLPAVPTDTSAQNAARDLGWLVAERARDRLPAHVVENPRWSQECAAHDEYEAASGVLQVGEDPTGAGASVGGAWAGLNSDLAEGQWTRAATPWENAPIHLLALLAPSLSVTGIDDSGTFQCAITFPGMVRRWRGADAITTVPAAGARNVPGSELARESPFTTVQFVGLPAARATGRELFVYLNRHGQIGQEPVRILAASLTQAGRQVAVRWVDSGTRTVGAYLAGGILIPVDPLRPHTTYRARVSVDDGARTLTRSWSFTTR
jgi:hypothetical protein